MRIRKFDLPYSTKIFRIEPNCFTWKTGKENEFSTDFRTHDKYSKRLYHAFKYIWYVLHFLDFLFDDYPKLNFSFGFDTLTVYPDADAETNTVDGFASRTATGSFSVCRTGSGASANSVAQYIWTGFGCSSTAGVWNNFYRAFTYFNTSSLTSYATISDAVLSLYPYSTYFVKTLLNQSYSLVSATSASDTNIVSADYLYTNFGTTLFAPAFDVASIAVSYNDFVFNSDGINAISLSGITRIGHRLEADRTGTAPSWSSGKAVRAAMNSADYTGTTTDPKLVITYTVSAPPTPTMKSYVY